MPSTGSPNLARAFCFGFKQISGVHQQTVVGPRSVVLTSKLVSPFTISSSFVSPVRFVHNKAYRSIGKCIIGSTHCLAKHQRKQPPFFEIERHLCTSRHRPLCQRTPNWRDQLSQLELELKQFIENMLGGGGQRRRSLRLSSSRREPLHDIDNNITNETRNKNRPITVAVEGNIGSGKSTLLKYFSKQDGVQVAMEPVQKWRENKGHNMLDLMYRDPARWSFAFQSYVQLTMLEHHQLPHTCPVKMMERSLFSAKYCFVEHLYKSKKMTSSEYMVLTEWFDWIVKSQNLQVDQIVYLRTSPENCQKRIKMRCRSEEQGIPMQYLEDLHELHEDWLIRGNNKFLLPAPVMVIDASKSITEMFETFEGQRNQILLQC